MTEPLEAQYYREYVTFSELFGKKPTVADFEEKLRDTGLHSIINGLSFINSVLYVQGTLPAQRDLVASTFAPDIKARIVRLPRLHLRALYSPAQILFIIKTAVLQSPNRNDARSDGMFGRAMNELSLMANDLIDAGLLGAVEGVKDSDELARMLLPHSVRSTMINAADAHDTTMPRASLMFAQVARRADVLERAGPVAFDIESRFKTVTGLSLQDYFGLGWMLIYWFAMGVRQPQKYPGNKSFNPATFFSQTRLDPVVGASLIERLTHDYASLGEEIRKRVSPGRLFSYDVVPFMERPLYRVRDDVVVPTNLAFLAGRLSTGVYWILFDAMKSRERDGWSAYYGHILEAYVRDTVIRSFPADSQSGRRAVSETVYHVGKQEMRTSDVIVLYPDAAVLFEVTATRIRMEATRLMEDPAAVEEDLQKVVLKKAKQLSDRIDHFRQGHYTLGGATAGQFREILPVVVTGEPIPLWTTTAKVVRQELAKRGLLQQAGVGPLRIISVDEVEMLEALVGQGVDPLEVLRKHAADPELRNVSLRNYMQRHYNVPPNATLQAEYLRIGNHAAQVLFGTHLGPPTHDEISSRAHGLFEARGRQHGQDLDDWLQAERDLFPGKDG